MAVLNPQRRAHRPVMLMLSPTQAVCHQIAQWRGARLRPVKVSLNLSGQDLQSPALAEFIEQIIDDWSSAAITSCVITLAQVLGLWVGYRPLRLG